VTRHIFIFWARDPEQRAAQRQHRCALISGRDARILGSMPRPERSQIIHAVEQTGAVLEELAPLLRQFHQALLKAGFSPEEALDLTAAALDTIIRMGRGRRRDAQDET